MNETERGELISAMADGQVSAEAFARGLQWLENDSNAQSTWDTYHLIGDVLRSPDLASGASSAAFAARLRPMLAQPAAQAFQPSEGEVLPAGRVGGGAANDQNFRWKLVAGLASVTAVAALGWNVISAGLDRSEGPQLAAVPAQQPVVQTAGQQRGLMLRDPRLDELLAAHRQFGSPAAIRMPTGAAVQNAGFEAPAR